MESPSSWSMGGFNPLETFPDMFHDIRGAPDLDPDPQKLPDIRPDPDLDLGPDMAGFYIGSSRIRLPNRFCSQMSQEQHLP